MCRILRSFDPAQSQNLVRHFEACCPPASNRAKSCQIAYNVCLDFRLIGSHVNMYKIATPQCAGNTCSIASLCVCVCVCVTGSSRLALCVPTSPYLFASVSVCSSMFLTVPICSFLFLSRVFGSCSEMVAEEMPASGFEPGSVAFVADVLTIGPSGHRADGAQAKRVGPVGAVGCP